MRRFASLRSLARGAALVLVIVALLGARAAAAPRATLTPWQEGLLVMAARALDPSGGALALDTAAGALRFSLSALTLGPAAAAGSQSDATAALSVRVRGGVVRWYTTAAPERELLALLVLDERRFVAWTPAGYFVAQGEGADSAVGVWSERADGRRHFVPARDFARDYQRPDIVRLVLDLGDEEQAVRQANRARGVPAAAPPLWRLLPRLGVVVAPHDGERLRGATGEVTVEILAPSGGAEVPAVAGGRGMVPSGGPGPAPRDTSVSWQEKVRFPLPPPPGDGAVDRTVLLTPPSMQGRTVPLHLTWDKGWRVALPDLYVLAVGVNQYQDSELLAPLRFAAKDAVDLDAALAAQQGRRYRRVVRQVLTDREATLPALRDRLAALQQKASERDVVMIFLAGHGITHKSGDEQRYYFMPTDGRPERPRETGLSDEELFRSLSRFRASTVVLFLDTCRAGTSPAQRRLMEELQASGGVVVYSATLANRPSTERARWGNGAFTRALVEGLRGAADVKGDGRITASSLEHYLSSRVKELTDGEQEPTTVKATTDLWLAQGRPQYHRKWWLWTLVGGVAAAGVLGTALGVALRPQIETVHFTFSDLRVR